MSCETESAITLGICSLVPASCKPGVVQREAGAGILFKLVTVGRSSGGELLSLARQHYIILCQLAGL